MNICKYWVWLTLCITMLTSSSLLHAWPEGSHINFNIRSETQTSDAIESTFIKLENPIFSLDWIPLSDWTTGRNVNKSASAQFTYRTAPTLTLQLIVYPKDTWLSDTRDASISQYIDSLPAQFPNSTIQITNEGQHKPPVGSVPFLEKTFRKIFYTVTPDKAKKPPFTVHDFWTITEDHMMVIARYQGADSIMINMSSTFERELAQFLLHEK